MYLFIELVDVYSIMSQFLRNIYLTSTLLGTEGELSYRVFSICQFPLVLSGGSCFAAATETVAAH